MSGNYLVRWEINIEDDDPVSAARKAFGHMQRKGTTATVFDVFDEDSDKEPVRVDLSELDEDEP